MTAMVCAAASRRDQSRATCFSGGGIGPRVPRSGQVPTTTSTPASRSRRTPSARCRTETAGGTAWVTSLAPIRITATSGWVRQGPVDLGGEVGGLGAHHGELAQVHPPVGPLGQAAGEEGAGRLLDPVDAVAGGAGVAEQGHPERRARAGRGRTSRSRPGGLSSVRTPIVLRASVASA